MVMLPMHKIFCHVLKILPALIFLITINFFNMLTR